MKALIKHRSMCFLSFLIACVVTISQVPPGFTQGWVLPERPLTMEEGFHLQLMHLDIQANITDQVAEFAVVQKFKNTGRFQSEATFYFPLPRGSQITQFSYTVNGKELKGEILRKDKAREEYENIVRTARDPGILEYLHQDLFRAQIFPVPPGESCVLKIHFTQLLQRSGNLYTLDYPLYQKQYGRKTAPFSPRATMVFNAELASTRGVQQVYSPSHKIHVVKKDENHAVAGFEGKIADVGQRSLKLFFKLGNDPVGISLMSYRKPPENGFFLLLLSPLFAETRELIQAKDVLFVLDVSGSMAGEKIEQAKQALYYCLDRLNPRDRFNIIAFSTEVDTFAAGLQNVDEKSRAKKFVGNLEATGSTNIAGALETALAMNRNPNRLFAVIFLTDGLPTVGERDENTIVRNVVEHNRSNTRIFTFGVGYDVNTYLIDQIAEKTNALAEYVKPDENIEQAVSSLYSKISHPILTDLQVNFADLDVYEYYPKRLPDLFKDAEIVVVGRYRNPGEREIVLNGKKEKETYRYAAAADFAEANEEYDFIPTLWASRKIGYLLDEIRMNGENEELVDEIVRLSKQYGIVTPYTSYLAKGDEMIALQRRRQRRPYILPLGGANQKPGTRIAIAPNYSLSAIGQTGKDAVEASQAISSMKQAEVMLDFDEPGTDVRMIAGRSFKQIDGMWAEITTANCPDTVKIRFASPAYFALLELKKEWMAFFKLGDRVAFSHDSLWIVVGEEGLENCSIAELKRKLKL